MGSVRIKKRDDCVYVKYDGDVLCPVQGFQKFEYKRNEN